MVALADTLNFRRAAGLCNISQPALTAQLQALEARLGVQLFERTKRRVLLTPVGSALVARARAILRDVEQLADSAKAAREPLSGPLRLGVIPTIGPYLLPRLLPAVRKAFPSLQLFLREDQTARLLERLTAGQLDLLLLALPVADEELVSLPLFDESFLLALPPDHPLARKTKIAETDLAGQEVLLLEEGHCLRDQALSVCRLAGAQEAPGFQATSLNTLSQMVANGLGLSLLPALSVEIEERLAKGIVVRPFGGEPPYRRIGLVWRRSSGRAREFEMLGDFLRSRLPPAVSPAGAPEARPDRRAAGRRAARPPA